MVFDSECSIELWNTCNKPSFIFNIVLEEWISFSDMTDSEKETYPKAYVCDGFLKTHKYKDAWKRAFDNKEDGDLELLKALPNFSSDKFEQITGIKL